MTLSVLCATTANVSGSGETTIDGVATSTSRVLVKDQNQPKNNGIYVTSSGSWSRATDMNSWSEVVGAMVVVQKGTVNAGTLWLSAAPSGGTLDTTAIPFAQAPHTFTPEEFGAVGDGSTDDHAALDAMCRTIELLGKGTALFKGRYAISDTLILPAVPFSFKGVACQKTTNAAGSIICTDGTKTILDFDWDDPDAGVQFELLDLNLGYSLGGDAAPTGGIALDMRFAKSAKIDLSLNNCFNGVYAGVCRDSEISLSGRNFAPREGDLGYALKFDSSIADEDHAKGTNVWVPRLFINAGTGGEEPGVDPPLANFVALDMLGASTVNLGECQMSSAEIGWRMRMVETDVAVVDDVPTYPKGSLQCSGITMAMMSSEGCEQPLDWGGFDKVHVLKMQCNATFDQCTIGDKRDNYDPNDPSVTLTPTATITSSRVQVDTHFTHGSIVIKNPSNVAPTVRYKLGDSSVVATLSDTRLPADASAAVSLNGATHVAMIAESGTAALTIIGNLPPADEYGGPCVFGECTIVNAHSDAMAIRSGTTIIANLQLRNVGSDDPNAHDGIRWEGGTLQVQGGRSGGAGNGELSGFNSRYGINLRGTDQCSFDQIDIHGVDVRGNMQPMGVNNLVTTAKAVVRDMVGTPRVFSSATFRACCRPAASPASPTRAAPP